MESDTHVSLMQFTVGGSCSVSEMRPEKILHFTFVPLPEKDITLKG